eukprot:COSAG02_NODE_715_length_18086_cov_109.753433_11_plen_341_part_00
MIVRLRSNHLWRGYTSQADNVAIGLTVDSMTIKNDKLTSEDKEVSIAKQQFVRKVVKLGSGERSGLSVYCTVGSRSTTGKSISRSVTGSLSLDDFTKRMESMIQRESDDDEIISPISLSITYTEDQRLHYTTNATNLQSSKQTSKQRPRDDHLWRFPLFLPPQTVDGFMVLPAEKKGESNTLSRKKMFSDRTYRYEPQYEMEVIAETIGIRLNSTTVRCLGNVFTTLLSLERHAVEEDIEDERVPTDQQSLDSSRGSNCHILRYGSCHSCSQRLHIGCFCKCSTHHKIQDTSEEDEDVDEDPPAEWTKMRLRALLKKASLELSHKNVEVVAELCNLQADV